MKWKKAKILAQNSHSEEDVARRLKGMAGKNVVSSIRTDLPTEKGIWFDRVKKVLRLKQ